MGIGAFCATATDFFGQKSVRGRSCDTGALQFVTLFDVDNHSFLYRPICILQFAEESLEDLLEARTCWPQGTQPDSTEGA
jgi:hypothetical protein